MNARKIGYICYLSVALKYTIFYKSVGNLRKSRRTKKQNVNSFTLVCWKVRISELLTFFKLLKHGHFAALWPSFSATVSTGENITIFIIMLFCSGCPHYENMPM